MGFLTFHIDGVFQDPASFCRMSIERGVTLVEILFRLRPGNVRCGVPYGRSHVPIRMRSIRYIVVAGTFPWNDQGLEGIVQA